MTSSMCQMLTQQFSFALLNRTVGGNETEKLMEQDKHLISIHCRQNRFDLGDIDLIYC